MAKIASGDATKNLLDKSAKVRSRHSATKAPAASMSKEERSAVARKATASRWGVMLEETDVARIIAETVRDQMAPCTVKVNVKEGLDEEGDTLLIIDVIIKTNQEPDKRKMLGLVRHIRASLENEAETFGFPLLNFMSSKEATKKELESI